MPANVGDVDFDLHSRVAAWIGASGLLLLALSPLFMWIKFGSGGVIGIRGDGKIVLAVTVLAMLAFGVAVLGKKHFPSLLLASQAWASIAVFWMAGLIWRVGGVFDAPEIRDNPFVGMLASQVSPGGGLYLGLIGALLAGGGIGFLAVRAFSPTGEMHLYCISQGSAEVVGILIALSLGATHGKGTSVDPDRPSRVSLRGEIGAQEESAEGRMVGSHFENAAYIAESLELCDVTAKYMDSLLDGRVPGVLFKLRNKGDRSLDEVEVSVFFKGANGNIIAEEKFHPVLVTEYSYSGSKSLKPGDAWQIFHWAKSIPTEWIEGAVDASITDIRFSGSG